MAIAIRGTTPGTATSTGNPITLSLTGTRQPNANDVLIIISCNNFYAATNIATPTVAGSTTGVTAITTADDGTDQGHAKAFYYVVGSTGDLTVSETETGSADEEKALIVYVLSGVDTANPVDTSANGNNGSVTTHNAPSVSPTSSDAYLICHVNSGPSNLGAFTPPSGMTEQYDAIFNSALTYTGATVQLSASGATGAKAFTSANLGRSTALSIAVKTSSGAAAAPSPLIPRLFSLLSAPFVGPHARALQLFGDAVTDQWPQLADTATASDALTVTATFSIDDATSAAADALAVAAAVPLTDLTNTTTDEISVVRPNDPYQALPIQEWFLLNPGTGPHSPILQLLGDSSGSNIVTFIDVADATDVLTTAPAIPLADTAAADDAVVAAVAAPLSDTAAGTDALTVAAALTVADTAAAGDSLSAQVVGAADAFQPPQSLPGMFVSPRLASPQLLGDMATGAVPLLDTAAAADLLSVAPFVPLSDTGTGTDAVTVAATTSALTETADGADALAISVTITLTDTAAATDSLSVLVAGEQDQNQAWPQVPVDPPPLQLLGDATTGTSGGTNLVDLTDSAAAADALTVSVALALPETAASVDSLDALAGPLLSELVAAADALAIQVVLAVSDVAAGSDILTVGGSGIQGHGRGRGPHSAPGNVYPRATAGIVGAIR